jgi:hypothetical protein
MQRSVSTMLRMYTMYQPLRTFMLIGGALSFIGLLPITRFLYFYVLDGGQGHVQSLVLGSVMLMIGLTTFLIGLVADLIGFNRQLIEMTLEKVRRMELEQEERNQALAGKAEEEPRATARRKGAQPSGTLKNSA